jgi:hypothetical protein
MKKFITLTITGLFLLSLQPAGAQQQVEPPAIPPILEGQRPLAQPESREPTAPMQVEKSQAKAKPKTKAKAGKKAVKKAGVKKAAPKKDVKKKAQKTNKKKPQETGLKHRGGAAVS